ncbi:MAG: energy-coupling factor transporter transmembrane protein EcfT [Oscillospiraceae bacterium]|nr:energy-coupling factor transporter transmembrane protein EcfT [Oscillospiraceae bacterium]
MLKDITFGQYFPGDSVIHKLDPRMKLILVIAYIIMLFVADGLLPLLVGAGMVVLFYALSKLPWKLIIKCIKPILPIVIFTAVLNIFFVEGDPIFEWGFISISGKGVLTAVLMCIRIICLIAGSSLLTYTTTPIALTDGLERLMKPLQKIKVPVHELSMMMTIALRFIPTLIDETQKIMSAQKARGADMESGNIIQRAKALIPILIPLFVSAFRRADELALAMECRCYHGGEGRTRMKQLKLTAKDWIAALVVAGGFAAVILINIYGPGVFRL